MSPSKQNDVGHVGSHDAASVSDEMVSITKAEYDALLAQNQGVSPTNTAPAFESGPHLDDPNIRNAKREQMIAAIREGDLDPDDLTDDMAAILEEGE